MAMTRAQFKQSLWEGLNAIFGMTYKDYQKEWPGCFKNEQSGKAWEEDVLRYAFDAAPEKVEGEGVTYDQGGESYTARYVNKTYALAFAITEEAIDDNQYGNLGRAYSEALARSMYYTEEIVHADVFNNGHTSGFTGGDGQTLYSTAHPIAGGGTLSNKLATPADLSETSLEAACIQIEKWTDERGIPIKIMPKKLVLPVDLQFDAERILKSSLRSGTADNDTNAMKSMGKMPHYMVSHFLTDVDSWHIVTDAPHGLKHFDRKKIQRRLEGDFETGNMRYKVTRRFSAGWTDWRGGFSSEGGA